MAEQRHDRRPPRRRSRLLEFVDGYWYRMDGTEEWQRTCGRNRRYATELFANLAMKR